MRTLMALINSYFQNFFTILRINLRLLQVFRCYNPIFCYLVLKYRFFFFLPTYSECVSSRGIHRKDRRNTGLFLNSRLPTKKEDNEISNEIIYSEHSPPKKIPTTLNQRWVPGHRTLWQQLAGMARFPHGRVRSQFTSVRDGVLFLIP